MNKARRAQITALIEDIDEIISSLEDEENQAAMKEEGYDWAAIKETAEEFKTRAEEIRDEEQEYYDNMPESFQNGEKGENAQSVISELDSAIDEFDLVDVDLAEAADGEEKPEDNRCDETIERLNSAREYVDNASGY